MRRRLNLLALLLIMTARPAYAQISGEGTVRGVIRDADGGVLPGVTVTAVSPRKARRPMCMASPGVSGSP